MHDKIEVWPKIIAICVLVVIPFIFAYKENLESLIWLVIVLSIVQIYILLVNDERIFDVHKRLRKLEKQEEDKNTY